MKKLLAMFQGLPPEVRLLIAMAGLGTPIGLIWFLQSHVFKGASMIVVVLGVAALILVLSGLGWLISKLFGRAARQRKRKMESELASSAEGGGGAAVSMSLRAAVKSNNEKFFTAIKSMRKLGISVYDLPWYVVIGDSGCGKTKLINEGGLTFSTGKPEGYQLGTLNYNWWFTEEAIFVDMAGRLCNPQDDADYREWDAFLKTVGAGRRGYPINGVLACVSAEHLLQDPPEKREQDANTMLERLRDLQNKLGVTFATYLLVTKCDKILGFMPYFDRAAVDITVKNQIFGWSRAGSFSELYDPETFGESFDATYTRLNELRLKRLTDDVDEGELGLAYSFPEEFRELKEPLWTYVRTLFPGIKNPRAVKNLIFRGVYFTSATQQGGLILRHLTERLGAAAATQFQPLESLYPRPRPHFVKELLLRKVLPENGLVFRNEQEVLRNRKLARALLIGGGIVSVLLLVLLFTSMHKFGRLVSQPREWAQEAPSLVSKPPEALARTADLGGAIHDLRGSIWATILSLGYGSEEPVRDLTKVQALLFERGVIRPVAASADSTLRTGKIVPDAEAARGGVAFKSYLAALKAYLVWYGCANEAKASANVDATTFGALAGIVSDAADPLMAKRKELLEQADQYFLTIKGAKDLRGPARLLAQPGFDAPATIRAAVANLHTFLRSFAELTPQHPDPAIAEWMRLRVRCVEIETGYRAILAGAQQPIETQEQLDDFAKVFIENYDKIKAAMAECNWKLKEGGRNVRIPSLREALLKQRKTWIDDYQTGLLASYAACGTSADEKAGIETAIKALVSGDDADLRGLQRILWESIVAAGLAEQRPYSADLFGDDFNKLVQEVDVAASHILTVKRAGDNPTDDRIELTADLSNVVMGVLDRVASALAAGAGGKVSEAPADWIVEMQKLVFPEAADATGAPDADALAKLNARWERQQLAELNSTYLELIRKARGAALLAQIEKSVQPPQPWGLAELSPKYRETVGSAYYIPAPPGAEPRSERKAEATPPAPPKGTGAPPPPGKAPKPPGAPGPVEQPKAPIAPPPEAGAGTIPTCASPDFFSERARECVQLLWYLDQFKPQFYLARAGETPPRNQRCRDAVTAAWKRYCETYVDSWKAAYEQKKLERLAEADRTDANWEAFASQFRTGERGQTDRRVAVQEEFRNALQQILQAVPWAFHSAVDDWEPDLRDSTYGEQNRRVDESYRAALRERWPEAAFAGSASVGHVPAAPNLKPWERVANEFSTRWGDWAKAVGRDAQVIRPFDPSAPPTIDPIPWDAIATLQSETGLREERITAQMVAFQMKARALLNTELTAKFCRIQTDALGDQSPYDGWPYLNKDGAGRDATDTVDFRKFTGFLVLVQDTAAALRPLEKDLPDDPIRSARQGFVRACEDWRKFLDLDAKGNPTSLSVQIAVGDPLGVANPWVNIDDTAQNFYEQIRLTIGLLRKDDPSAAQALEFQTRRDASATQTAIWSWARPANDLTFELVNGLKGERNPAAYPPINAQLLGKPSELAFCAFLHRYGRAQDGTWVVLLAMDLPEKFNEKGRSECSGWLGGKKLVGVKLVFQLTPAGRNLPDPIPKLGPAPANEAAQPRSGGSSDAGTATGWDASDGA